MNADEQFLVQVDAELLSARARFPNINNVHEGYAIILEEVCEFFDEVRRKQSEHDPVAMRKELVQVAAMAARCAVDCDL